MGIVKYRQLIRPGQSGRDVRAVKNAMIRMHVAGSGGLAKTKNAGDAFVHCIKVVQRNHGFKVDGIYGPHTHKVIAKHFSPYDRWLYRTARKRKPPIPPLPPGTSQVLAKRLLQYHKEGKYRDDSGTQLRQIELTAQGKPVWSPAGRYVYIDNNVIQSIVWLIENNFRIGTYAMCSDHGYDGMLGHAGGHAVDISSINGMSIAAHNLTAREFTLKVAKLLNQHGHVWQLICDGYGYVHDGAIADCTVPNAAYYGSEMANHRNHIHAGFR